MSFCHHQCYLKRRTAARPANFLASEVTFTPFIAKKCCIFAWWEYPGSAEEVQGVCGSIDCCCAPGHWERAYAIHMLFEAHCRYRHKLLGLLMEMYAKTQENGLSFAWWPLLAEAGEKGVAPQWESPCSCLSLMWRKQHCPAVLPSQMLHREGVRRDLAPCYIL